MGFELKLLVTVKSEVATAKANRAVKVSEDFATDVQERY